MGRACTTATPIPLSHGPCWVGRVRSLRQLPRFRLSVIARDTEVSSEKQASSPYCPNTEEKEKRSIWSVAHLNCVRSV